MPPSAHSLVMVPGAVGHNDPEDHACLPKGFPPKAATHIVRNGIRNLDDNTAHVRWLAIIRLGKLEATGSAKLAVKLRQANF